MLHVAIQRYDSSESGQNAGRFQKSQIDLQRLRGVPHASTQNPAFLLTQKKKSPVSEIWMRYPPWMPRFDSRVWANRV